MYDFHHDRKRYFDIQIKNTEEYVIPFIEEKTPVAKGMRVLEIGCGEAGVLKAFVSKGCTGVGVEYDSARIDNAMAWLESDVAENRIQLIVNDIYLVSPDDIGRFDIIVLKDVIEHIPNQKKLIHYLQSFLTAKGVIFLGFPPWQMPFGGHQQICRGRLTSRMPYYHLLPRPVYKAVLKRYNEPVDELMEIRDTGISIERFEKIVKEENYRIVHRRLFLINPIYKWKFGWKVRSQIFPVNRIPFVRNFFTTCVYYLISPK